MDDDKIKEVVDASTALDDSYEFIIKDSYGEIYSRDDDEFSFGTLDLDNPELNISLLLFENDK